MMTVQDSAQEGMRTSDDYTDELTERIRIRWKNQREAYEKEAEEEKQLCQEANDVLTEEIKIQALAQKAKDKYKKCLLHLYSEVEMESELPSSDVLLLPSIHKYDEAKCNDDSLDSLVKLGLTTMQRIGVQRMLSSLKSEKRKAVNDALHYCNLAEDLRREDLNRMNSKIELVRDFWRNELCEGATRSGRMVQLALNKKQ